MQFKNPEVLYFLVLLIIPIIVHLFQLQKFVKVPFTNVAFLKKIIQDNRKSSRLKKWLILACRMLLFTAILFAFSQPYFSENTISKKQHTFIYLDNSLSTDSKGEKGNILEIAKQDIIKNSSEKDTYSLLTNTNFVEDINKSELKNALLSLENSTKNSSLESILLKAEAKNKNKTNTLYNTILISDFQYTYKKKFTNVTTPFSAIKLNISTKDNISIDSVFLSNPTINNFTVNAIIKNQGTLKNNLPIAIYNKEKLISKQTFSIDANSNKIIQFTIQNQPDFEGKLDISFSDTFNFDNVFYFSLNPLKKINVLAIGNNNDFLSKIYTEEEFNLSKSTVKKINYNTIFKQQIIILNELEIVPEILGNTLLDFFKKGGKIVIIPNQDSDLNSYNLFLQKLGSAKLLDKITDTLKITSINFKHPLFKNVFSKKVTNFQYPNIQSHFPLSSKNSSKIISFEDNSSFLSQINTSNGTYFLFSSALNKNNSNFLKSPLIVPVFYNFAKLSFQHSQLYYRVDQENYIDVDTSIDKDKVLSISGKNSTFIPIQQTLQNKVKITTNNQPLKAGFYYILKDTDTIRTLAYNFPKQESLLQFLDVDNLAEKNSNVTTASSIKEIFEVINKKNEVHWLWKWFLALAIVSLLLEILILKFYKT